MNYELITHFKERNIITLKGFILGRIIDFPCVISIDNNGVNPDEINARNSVFLDCNFQRSGFLAVINNIVFVKNLAVISFEAAVAGLFIIVIGEGFGLTFIIVNG